MDKMSTRERRNYEQINREDVCESPTSKDFVNSKNDNIWRIKEIDIRDKNDHDFSGHQTKSKPMTRKRTAPLTKLSKADLFKQEFS